MNIDHSSLVSWGIASIGLLVSWFGSKPTEPESEASVFFGSLLFTIFITVLLMFVAAIGNSVCIFYEKCSPKGFGFFYYWLCPVFMSPLYFMATSIRSTFGSTD